MSNQSRTALNQNITRIGITFDRAKELDNPALRFLIVYMNTLQKSFEFEILLSDPQDELFHMLSDKKPVDRERVRQELPLFFLRYKNYLDNVIEGYELEEQSPQHFVIVTMACFSDNYYILRKDNVAIIALGNWKRSMAPPSILEFILTLLLRQSVSFVSPSLAKSVHLGTKGCLFDFTPYLEDVKLKVLQGYICNHCRDALQAEGHPNLAQELVTVLKKQWLGKSTDPNTPAGITANLGCDLFMNKGLRPTAWENFLTTIQQEGFKQIVTIIGAVVIAGLLLWLGLKP